MIHIISSVLIASIAGIACIMGFALLAEYAPLATVAGGLLWLWVAKK